MMQPFTLLIKPSGSDCNIDCTYCFYKNRAPEIGQGRQRMSDEVLEKLIKDYFKLDLPVFGFAWQGGEPTVMGLDFFEKAVALQRKYGPARCQISNTMQTNAVLLDDKWCRFFRDNKFLLGVSIDGPKEYHDHYRVDHSGSGTFDKVIAAINNLKKYEVEFNTLTLLNDRNVTHPDELFDFFVANDLRYMQLIPCMETDPAAGKIADFSITPEQYGRFLCRIFDRWYEYGPEKLNIRDIDSLVSYFVLGSHTICTYSSRCSGFVVVEHTGDCFCCEFFVEPKWRLGNILETPLEKLAAGSTKRAFARAKQNLPNDCLLCRHLSVCRGGCMKYRFAPDGRAGPQSYFCESYKRFFDYAVPRSRQIAAAICAGSAARCTRSPDRIRLQIDK